MLIVVRPHSSNRLIVVLEGAALETVKVGKGYELLNCDDHAHILKKHKREPAECRPDISHQVCQVHPRSISTICSCEETNRRSLGWLFAP